MSSATLEHSPGLRLKGVGKTFRSRSGRPVTALRSVDLSIEGGEIVVIVGGSGCGKSTLLRIVAGLERQSEGTIAIGTINVDGPGPDRGMAFQEHRLLPWLTVAENVGFGLTAVAPEARRQLVREQLETVGLAGFESAYPHQLSGGMAQRAALARALAPNPGVLLLDEPFAALDAFTKSQMQEELLRLRGVRRPTLILVTHDIEEAVFLGDRIVVMSDRPGSVRRILPVGLSRPRDRTSEEFVRLRRAVLGEFFPSGSTRSDHADREVRIPQSLVGPRFAAELLPKESP